MRALGAVVAVAVVAGIAGLVLALSGRDQTALDLRSCALRKADAQPVRDIQSLRAVRTDLLAGTLREAPGFALRGDSWVTFLRPTDGLYVIAVVTQGDRPPRGVALRRLTTEPGTLPLAAYAPTRGVERLLTQCLDRARA